MRISERVRRIAPSLTLAVTQRAAQLRAAGHDIIGFGAGEPDFDTPDHIKQAAADAMARGTAGKYTAVPGLIELRRAVADEINRAHDADIKPEETIVSCGAKHALFNLFLSILDEDDEVIIPSPCWVSYPELVQMSGGRAVILETHADEGFQIDEHALAARMSNRTRAIVLCSPSNPTGALYDERSLTAVARVIHERGNPDLFVITDDIYRRLVYRGKWLSLEHVAPELRSRMIFIDGVSKAYAMTGWRIGYCAAPKVLIDAMITLQGQSTTNAATIAQWAALAGLTGPQETVEHMRREFDRRRQVMIEGLRRIPGLKVNEPDGAFYAFPDVTAFLGRDGIVDDVQLAERILEGGVALVPGSGFLAPGFVRLSYATSMKNIEAGVARLAATLSSLA